MRASPEHCLRSSLSTTWCGPKCQNKSNKNFCLPNSITQANLQLQRNFLALSFTSQPSKASQPCVKLTLHSLPGMPSATCTGKYYFLLLGWLAFLRLKIKFKVSHVQGISSTTEPHSHLFPFPGLKAKCYQGLAVSLLSVKTQDKPCAEL